MALPPPDPPSLISLLTKRRQYQRAFGSGAPTPTPGGGFTSLPERTGGIYSGFNSVVNRLAGTDYAKQAYDIIDPQLQAAADLINRRSRLASSAISSLTNSYANLVGQSAGQIPGFYKPEVSLARKVAGYSRDALTSAGTTSAAGLSKDLAQAGVAGPGDINLTQQGAGAGNAAYGTGIAELDALVSRRIAAQTEAALEPSIAQSAGTYQQGLVAAQLGRQLADMQAQLTAQIPGILQDLRDRAEARQRDTRDFNEKVREYNQDRADAAATLKAQQAAAAQDAAAKGDEQAYKVALQNAKDLSKGAHQYTVGRDKNGNWVPIDLGPKIQKPTSPTKLTFQTINGRRVGIDPVSGKIVRDYGPAGSPSNKPTNLQIRTVNRGGKPHDVAIDPKTGKVVVDYGPHLSGGTAAGGKKGGLTENQLQNLIQKWHGSITISQSTSTNAKGEQSTTQTATKSPGSITYQQAYQKLRGMGYSDQEARSRLNSVWKRGEGGRPYLGPNARAALKQAGLRPAVNYEGININKQGKATKQIPYLTERQAKALKAAGLLPPGRWAQSAGVAGPIYVVAAGY